MTPTSASSASQPQSSTPAAALQLAGRHVRRVPAILRNDAAIGLGSGIDDREDGGPLVIATKPDIAYHRDLGARFS